MGDNATRKVVILLLILAIVFSAVSIFVGLYGLQLGPSEKIGSGQEGANTAGTVGFFVETPPEGSGG